MMWSTMFEHVGVRSRSAWLVDTRGGELRVHVRGGLVAELFAVAADHPLHADLDIGQQHDEVDLGAPAAWNGRARSAATPS